MEKAKKILMIDDDPDFTDGVQALLKAANYDVAIASNPKEGKEKIFCTKET